MPYGYDDTYLKLEREIKELTTFPTRVGLELIEIEDIDNNLLVEAFTAMRKEKRITGELIGSADDPILIVHSVDF
ncbi:hypothetical protein ACWN8V_01415 [Vagococcus elongatus]|uniref:Uncharacterized protein n=1 Tax=Vagococcus elongatus TaxID=180344 RepID=A0A430B619_9ENTE|nr:hypothetical protein [Vagococcus elongatus]RSU15753.1 hypothetical protein CBF29_01390 [Vagococcus elongatus]